MAIESGKIDNRTKISRLHWNQEQSAVVPEGCHVGDPLYGPLQQQGIHSLLEVLSAVPGPEVDRLTHWWVSWGLCWNVRPTTSSTMPVARQLPSRLLQCGAKSARRAPTWTPLMPPGWGSCSSLLSPAALIWVGSSAGSPAGTGSKGLLLCHSSLSSSSCRRSKTIKNGRKRKSWTGSSWQLKSLSC